MSRRAREKQKLHAGAGGHPKRADRKSPTIGGTGNCQSVGERRENRKGAQSAQTITKAASRQNDAGGKKSSRRPRRKTTCESTSTRRNVQRKTREMTHIGPTP